MSYILVCPTCSRETRMNWSAVIGSNQPAKYTCESCHGSFLQSECKIFSQLPLESPPKTGAGAPDKIETKWGYAGEYCATCGRVQNESKPVHYSGYQCENNPSQKPNELRPAHRDIDYRMAEDHIAKLISAVIVSGNKEMIDLAEMTARQVFGLDAITVHIKHKEAVRSQANGR